MVLTYNITCAFYCFSLQHVNRTLSSVGGTVAAACAAWEEYVCRHDYLQKVDNSQMQHLNEDNKHLCWGAHVAGGTHHAFFDYGGKKKYSNTMHWNYLLPKTELCISTTRGLLYLQ